MDYLVIYEQGPDGTISAYVPDLPGLGVTGQTFDEARRLISEGTVFHIEGLREDGEPVPPPSAIATGFVHVDAA